LTQSKYSIPPKVENRHRDLGKEEKKTHSLSQGGAGKQDHERKKMILSQRERERKHQRELRDVRKRTKSAKEQRQKKQQQQQ
jgi:hypothetical protein